MGLEIEFRHLNWPFIEITVFVSPQSAPQTGLEICFLHLNQPFILEIEILLSFHSGLEK
jgi:hypothetical protein